MDNPYSAPQTDLVTPPDLPLSRAYGGIGRLAYFGLGFLLAITHSLLVVPAAAFDTSGLSGGLLTLALFVVGLVLAAYRLKNIGMSRWWCLLMIVPLVNLFVGIRCIAYQEGYVETKKLDTAGRIIIGAILAFIGLVILGAILSEIFF